jgi:hypothetical protein
MVKLKLPQMKHKNNGVVVNTKPDIDIRAQLDPQLNEGQKSALLLMLRFVGKRDRNMFVLKGYAGTGKSFLINRFIKEVIKTKSFREIAITAPTNKAVKVLRRGSTLDIHVRFCTIHSLLGLTQKINSTGHISFTADKKNKSTISRISLLIVDETSMLSDDLFRLLQDEVEKHKGALRIIFVGDGCQIPPVNKVDCIPFKRGLSEGYSEEGYTLTEIMRQAKGNPILEAAYNIRENLKDPYCTKDVKTDNNYLATGFIGTQVLDSKKGETDLLTNLSIAFTGIHFNSDADYAKVIAWTNATVKKYNTIIRNMIFNNPIDKIVAGDKLIANSPIMQKNEIIFNTSDELEVISVTKKELNFYTTAGPVKLQIYNTVVKEDGNGNPETLDILHEDSYAEFDRVLSILKTRAVESGSKDRWVNYYDFMKKVADVAYNYAITAHKAQGSTYTNVFIIEDDIDANRNIVERNRIKYTAYTRASKRLFIYKKV